MDHSMTKEESYADRRQLFKNIWDTSIDQKKGNVIHKPKVIKTLKLDEVCRARKKKNKRMKKMKIVCNKLLDFCHRQGTGNMFYVELEHVEQMMLQRRESPSSNEGCDPKKSKVTKVRKRAKSVFKRLQDASKIQATLPDRFLKINNLSSSSSLINTKGRYQSVPKNYRKRKNSSRIEKYLGDKMLTQYYASRKKYSANKTLFPINKITI